MAYKLAQVAGSGAEQTLYTVTGGTSMVVSSIVICNRTALASTFSIAVLPSGGATADANWIYKGIPILANDTFVATMGLTLPAGAKVNVTAGAAATMSFSLFGDES